MANRIALELIADANPLLKGLQQAQQSIDRFADAAADAGHAIGGGLSSAIDKFTNFSKGGAAAAGLLAGGMAAAAASAVALTASAGREVEAIDMLSQKTGIAVTTLQSWSVIMAENDFQAESLTSSMRTLSKKIVEARDPASEAAKAFKDMGIQAKDLGSTESVIRAVADRFAEMPDGIDKANYASELFGKAGLELIPILNRGSKALDESKEAAKRFGADLNELQRSGLKNADDAMDRVGVAATALKQNLASVFAPAVEYGAQALAEVMGILARWAREVDTALDTLAIRITHIGLAAKELGAVLFSKDVIDTAAWRQAFDNISMIDKEAAKLIEKRRALAITPDTKGSDVALGASKSVQRVAKAAKPVRGDVQDEHVREFQEVQRLTEQYRKGLIELSNQSAAALRKELDLYFETEKKIDVVTDQEQAGMQIVQQATEAWAHRNDALEMAAERAKVVDDAQQALFQTEGVLFGNSENAIRARMELIEAEGALRRRTIEESIFDERKRTAALENLDLELDTKRRQAVQAFPTFFQQQMKAIVDSNAFSISQITTTWTSGLANAAVNGGNFVQQAWKSTQMAVLQGFLNLGVQLIAREALTTSVRLGIISSATAAEMGLNTAKNATIVAGDAAAATATTSIWAGAGAAITGTFAAVSGAIAGFFTGTIIPMFVTLGEVVTTFLSAIATSLDISIFGAAFSIPVWAAVGVIAAAVGVIAAFAFADGGVVTGPTMGLIGEAGSSEAVIPLNKRGAAFMREALGGGGGGGGPTTVIVELDGRVLTKSVFENMPSVMRLRGMTA
jgi:hypothetical protein